MPAAVLVEKDSSLTASSTLTNSPLNNFPLPANALVISHVYTLYTPVISFLLPNLLSLHNSWNAFDLPRYADIKLIPFLQQANRNITHTY